MANIPISAIGGLIDAHKQNDYDKFETWVMFIVKYLERNEDYLSAKSVIKHWNEEETTVCLDNQRR